MIVDLDAEQRDTVEQIFARPSSGNVEWWRVRSLLDAVATVSERHNVKLEVTLDQPNVSTRLRCATSVCDPCEPAACQPALAA